MAVCNYFMFNIFKIISYNLFHMFSYYMLLPHCRFGLGMELQVDHNFSTTKIIVVHFHTNLPPICQNVK